MSESSLSEPEPFSLPLSRDSFRRALHGGRGRAQLHVERHGGAGLEDLILDAVGFDRAYDLQVEGSRAEWLVELVDAAGLAEPAAREVVRRLDDPSTAENTRDLDQVCDLAAIFARRGNDDARVALYRAFRKRDGSADLIGATQIIDLDGADGLVFLAQRMGEMYSTGVLEWSYEELLEQFDERHGEQAARKLLDSVAQHDPRVANFLAHQEPRGSGRVLSDSTMSAAAILERFDQGAHKALPISWGRNASEEELRVFAERMFREQDPDRLEWLVSAFQRRALPEFDVRMLPLADHPSEGVRWRAIQALANYEAPEVRSLALARARVGRIDDGAVELFRENYVSGDWLDVIARFCRLPADDIGIHGFLSDVLHIFEKRRTDESRAPLLVVYEHTPCSHCRQRAFEVLVKLAAAPAWVAEECRRDCQTDARGLATRTA